MLNLKTICQKYLISVDIISWDPAFTIIGWPWLTPTQTHRNIDLKQDELLNTFLVKK